MLVLTRKRGEGILIDNDIRLEIVEVKGGTVRLGIDAPQEKKIYREEVYQRINAENRSAAQWQPDDLATLLDDTVIATRQESAEKEGK